MAGWLLSPGHRHIPTQRPARNSAGALPGDAERGCLATTGSPVTTCEPGSTVGAPIAVLVVMIAVGRAAAQGERLAETGAAMGPSPVAPAGSTDGDTGASPGRAGRSPPRVKPGSDRLTKRLEHGSHSGSLGACLGWRRRARCTGPRV